MQLFAGSSNQPLAQAVAEKLGIPLGKLTLSRFANSEARVLIEEKKVDKEVVILQSLSAPTDEHLVELVLIADALKRSGAKSITTVIPYLGYSKQDKVFLPGEPLSVKAVAQMLQVVPLERVITFDLHNQAILGFFDVPVTHLSANQLFLNHFRSKMGDKVVVVAPDAGAVKAGTEFAKQLNLPVAYIDKSRNLITGEVSIVEINRDVRGHQIIILDDMISTGSTLIEVARFLNERDVQNISVAATHHLYVPEAQNRLDQSSLDSLVVTDTNKPKSQSEKLHILSVAPLIAETLAA
jgi:ribose-phosphate pyrophosphokinase